MPLILETPDTRAPERDYILSVVLGEFLGLSWQRVPSNRTDTRITLQGHKGEILMPDILLQTPDEHWLTPQSLPSQPLPAWDTTELGLPITLVDKHLPVIYGAPLPPTPYPLPHNPYPLPPTPYPLIHIPLDVFSSAFFMLTRYEEVVKPDRDEHDRFPAYASLAFQEGFLDRPIVDEYVEVLWEVMKNLWPGLERKRREGRIFVTCDVDCPFCYDGSLGRMVRRFGGDVIKRRSLRMAANTLAGTWLARRGDYHLDPHYAGIQRIMAVNEQHERKVAFYFIPVSTDPAKDNQSGMDLPRMRSLIREISARGHEIGIHPGYNTYRHPEALGRSVANLRRVLSEEKIEQSQIGSRQHFLRWQTPTTARLLDENGLDYDTSLGFADQPGFRCGTCREYPLYDLDKGRALHLRERPLIVMECSVIAKRYMGLGYSDKAFDLMRGYRETCFRLDGNFTLLWHNSHFTTPKDQQFYQELLERNSGKELS